MAKRSGPYKQYLEGDTRRIPRRTQYRWNLAKRRKEVGKFTEEHENGDDILQNMNNNETDEENTEDNSSSSSGSNSEEEDEGLNENVPTKNLCSTDIQETINEADRNITEDEDDEEDNEKSSTTSLVGTDIQVNEDLSDSERDMPVADRSEEENNELSASGEKASQFSMVNEDIGDKGDKPLYPGAPLSKGESLLMLMAYLLRHNLTGEALTHLLEMFNIMFPGLIPSSHYLFHKEFGRSSTFEVHFYCERCLKYLGVKNDCPFQCDSCNTLFDADANLKKGFYFLVLPLRAQIKQLLQEHSSSLSRNARTFGIVSDIQSGEEYQKLCDSGVLGKDDLTLIWNCDGAPVFKSSKYSIWPIQYQVTELHPDVRKKHILMSALWCGPGKPSMFTLLTPFVKEASLLETEGIDWQDIQGNRHVSKVFVLICSSDSVARPLLRNTKQFNGFYGCDFCYHKGGKTYPYDRPEPPLRNERSFHSCNVSIS